MRKRKAEDWDEWKEWLRTFVAVSIVVRLKEVAWWDHKAQQVQDKADQGDAFGVFATFKELRNRGAPLSLGEVRPADAPF